MRTEKQIEASRLNGAKSHGPVTEDGKARSAANALKHGFTADTLVLTNEDGPRFYELLDGYTELYQPATAAETDALFEAVAARWRMRRVWSIETALLDLEMDRQTPGLANSIPSVDESTRLALAWAGQMDNCKALPTLTRYEARLSRQFERAMKRLESLQSVRTRTEAQEAA
jgi:hypothetical protein